MITVFSCGAIGALVGLLISATPVGEKVNKKLLDIVKTLKDSIFGGEKCL